MATLNFNANEVEPSTGFDPIPAGKYQAVITDSEMKPTKTGNGHARRLLVEAAWHHRRGYRVPGATMQARWDLAPAAARARGHQGNHRLHARWLAFTERKKKPVIANVAIARELAGWCWSLAVMDD